MNKKIKCPKCYKLPFMLKEIWEEHTIDFDIDVEGNISKEGVCMPGYPNGIIAHCDCGHKWKLRKIIQINELRD